MPLIHVKISDKSITNVNNLQQLLSEEIASLTGKPENYVMTILESDLKMTFAGTDDPNCFIQIKSIGALKPKLFSERVCKLIESKTNINSNRIYIEFTDIKANNWGYNKNTFG